MLFGALLAPSATAAAQAMSQPEYPPAQGEATPRWVGHFTVLSANALLSGVTAGTMRRARGGSFSEGFTRGMAGGAVQYAGKAVVVQRWDGAGLVGREVAAVGTSMVRNAADGRGMLERVVLPVGPVRLHLRRGEGVVGARLDLHNLFWIGYGLLDPKLHFDAGASLSAGAPVFHAHDHRMIWRDTGHLVSGLAPPGTVLLAGDAPDAAVWREQVFAHERVHVLQADQVFLTLGDPLETSLLGRLPAVRDALKYFDANLLLWLAVYPVQRGLPYEHHPWEIEADFLAERR